MSGRRAIPTDGPTPGRTGLDTATPAPLHYVSTDTPGLRRRRVRGRFVYLDTAGRRVRDADEIARIERLAIPPAYRDVWICPDPNGHLQATARDARGRKQYRYHPLWVAARNLHKYCRMRDFGHALPRLRAAIENDLAAPGLPAEKVMAAVVALLDQTLIRIGNAQYVRENASFGLTTLRDRHVAVDHGEVHFRFRGKSGIEHRLRLDHPRLARILKRCQELPGQQLFQYVDDVGHVRPVSSSDINAYLKTHGGSDFSAKDYRTWAGSTLALALFRQHAQAGRRTRNDVVEVIAEVAAQLGNTPAICRKCYVHPDLIDAFLAGELGALPNPPRRKRLNMDEARLLAFLEARHTGGCVASAPV